MKLLRRFRTWRDESWFLAWLLRPFWRAWYGIGPGRLELRRIRRHTTEELRAALPYLHDDDVEHWARLHAKKRLRDQCDRLCEQSESER